MAGAGPAKWTHSPCPGSVAPGLWGVGAPTHLPPHLSGLRGTPTQVSSGPRRGCRWLRKVSAGQTRPPATLAGQGEEEARGHAGGSNSREPTGLFGAGPTTTSCWDPGTCALKVPACLPLDLVQWSSSLRWRPPLRAVARDMTADLGAVVSGASPSRSWTRSPGLRSCQPPLFHEVFCTLWPCHPPTLPLGRQNPCPGHPFSKDGCKWLETQRRGAGWLRRGRGWGLPFHS